MKQIKSLKDLQGMPVMVRVNDKEVEVISTNHFNAEYDILEDGISILVSFRDAQILTPLESPKYKGEHIAIGDWVKVDGGWYEVYGYFYQNGEWILNYHCLEEDEDMENDYFGKITDIIDHKKLSEINNSTFDKIYNDVKKDLEGYTTYEDSLTGPSIWFEQTRNPQTKKKIEKLSGSFAFTDNDHNVQDKINEIIDHLNNQK